MRLPSFYVLYATSTLSLPQSNSVTVKIAFCLLSKMSITTSLQPTLVFIRHQNCPRPATWQHIGAQRSSKHLKTSSTLIKKKIKFSLYLMKFKRSCCKVIYDWRPPHIWVNMCAFPIGSPSSYMSLQPIPYEFPEYMRKISFSFLSVHMLKVIWFRSVVRRRACCGRARGSGRGRWRTSPGRRRP